MATLQQVEQHRTALADLTTLALADLVSGWRTFDLSDATAVQRQSAALVADLVDGYGYTAGGMAADWYDEARVSARTSGTYRAVVAASMAAPQIEALAGWSAGPLYGAVDEAAALSRLAGGLQRLVTDADRTTILENTRRDPAQVRWYRAASANACAFCAMTASRGAVYRSESSGGFKSHNYCRCFAAPLFPGERVELPSYYQDFADAYGEAADKAQAETGTRSAKATLSAMRKIRGTR